MHLLSSRESWSLGVQVHGTCHCHHSLSAFPAALTSYRPGFYHVLCSSVVSPRNSNPLHSHASVRLLCYARGPPPPDAPDASNMTGHGPNVVNIRRCRSPVRNKQNRHGSDRGDPTPPSRVRPQLPHHPPRASAAHPVAMAHSVSYRRHAELTAAAPPQSTRNQPPSCAVGTSRRSTSASPSSLLLD